MDAAVFLFLALCIAVLAGVIWVGIRLDRRTQRRQSESWMRGWVIRTRVLRELYDRWHGPLRLQHQRSASDLESKGARRRKRSKEG